MKMKSLAYRAGRRPRSEPKRREYYAIHSVPTVNPGPKFGAKPESEKKTYFLHHRSKRKITLPHVTIQDGEL